MSKPDIYERRMVDVLTSGLKEIVRNQVTFEAFTIVGCVREDGFADAPMPSDYEMARHIVSRATKEDGSYNTHSTLAKWRGKYWYGWMNGMFDEEAPGQRCFVAHSDDAVTWSERILIADGDAASGMFRTLCAFCPHGDQLYAIIQTHHDGARAADPRLRAAAGTPETVSTDLWATGNGTDWHEVQADFIDIYRTTESPRLTAEGRLLAVATTRDTHPAVVLWPGDDPSKPPEVIRMPYRTTAANYFEGRDLGLFLYGEGSWYTDDDGRIWMWLRDESRSTYLSVAFSEDGGRSWAEPMRSNFPDSCTCLYAGRLSDGRFFINGNSTRMFMNRVFFALTLSDDGAKFNKMYRLMKEPTKQRFGGDLKGDGYQTPCCLVDGDRLLIGYCVNKEDVEIGLVDAKEI